MPQFYGRRRFRRRPLRRPRRRTYSRRSRRIPRPIGRAVRGFSKAIVPVKKMYIDDTTLLIPGGAAHLHFATLTRLQHVYDYLAFPAMFQFYRINKVKMEITAPTSVSIAGGNTGLMIYYKPRDLPGEVAPATENEWGAIAGHKRHIFGPGSTRTLKWYFTPFEWRNPASTVGGYEKQYKTWRQTPTGTVMSDFNGIVGTVMRTGTGNLNADDSMKIRVTLYLQLKGIV